MRSQGFWQAMNQRPQRGPARQARASERSQRRARTQKNKEAKFPDIQNNDQYSRNMKTTESRKCFTPKTKQQRRSNKHKAKPHEDHNQTQAKERAKQIEHEQGARMVTQSTEHDEASMEKTERQVFFEYFVCHV